MAASSAEHRNVLKAEAVTIDVDGIDATTLEAALAELVGRIEDLESA